MAVLTSTGITFSDATSTTTNLIPAGTQMLFFQTNAPTGWTKQTTHNNKTLRVVTGNGGGSGGNQAFTTAFANRSFSGTVSVSVGQHTLTQAQMPSHTHTILVGGADDNNHTGNYNGPSDSDAGARGWNRSVRNTGSGQQHSHNASGSLSGATLDVRVQYIDVVVGRKN